MKNEVIRPFKYFLLISAIYFAISIFLYLFKVNDSLSISALAVVFFSGCMLVTFLFIRNKGGLFPITWFIFGSGLFFGIGTLASAIRVHPHTTYLFGDDNFYLLKTNLLNSSSLLLVSIFAFVTFAYKNNSSGEQAPYSFFLQLSRKAFPVTFSLGVIFVLTKFICFPYPTSLLLLSLLSKLYLLLPSIYLSYGMLFRSLSSVKRILVFFLVFLDATCGLLLVSKYQILIPFISLFIGFLTFSTRCKKNLKYIFAFICLFIFIIPTVTLIRAHNIYSPTKNSLIERISIIKDVAVDRFNSKKILVRLKSEPDKEVKTSINFTHDSSLSWSFTGRIKDVLRRFDVVSVQGFLMNEYEEGNPGNSFSKILYIFIPRVIWKDKPIMTNDGSDLHQKYFYIKGKPQARSSSLAPSYFGEIYWNYGYLGVIGLSIFMGILLGGLSRISNASKVSNNKFFMIYPVISIQLCTWSVDVESWIVSTLFGRLIILLTVWILVWLVLLVYDLILQRDKSKREVT